MKIRLNVRLELTPAELADLSSRPEAAKLLAGIRRLAADIAADTVPAPPEINAADYPGPKPSTIRRDLLKNADWLRCQYIERKLSQEAIGDMCNCSSQTVSRYLRKLGIKPRAFVRAKGVTSSPSEPADPPEAADPSPGEMRRDLLLDADWMRQHYEDDLLGTTAIADLCNCSPNTVTKHLRRHGIEIWPPGGRSLPAQDGQGPHWRPAERAAETAGRK